MRLLHNTKVCMVGLFLNVCGKMLRGLNGLPSHHRISTVAADDPKLVMRSKHVEFIAIE